MVGGGFMLAYSRFFLVLGCLGAGQLKAGLQALTSALS